MHLTILSLLLAFLPFSFSYQPIITIQNTHTWQICFRVETGYRPNLTPIGSFPTNTLCSGFPGISVPALASSIFAPSPGWAGALTLINNGLIGSRFEFSFIENDGMNKPGNTFYDVDMELGISAATMGPTDHRVLYDGFSQSLAGGDDYHYLLNELGGSGPSGI